MRFLSFLRLQIRFQIMLGILTTMKPYKFYKKLRFKSAWEVAWVGENYVLV